MSKISDVYYGRQAGRVTSWSADAIEEARAALEHTRAERSTDPPTDEQLELFAQEKEQ